MNYPSWHILPTELWLVIFDLIESAKELANCRLVCKRWSALAGAAMLGQNLKFDTEESISKFNSQLKMKPQMARLIKSIHLPYTDDLNLPLQKELLDLALTPNIKHFQGQMSEEILIHFLEIAQRSSSKFDRLQVLPELYTMDNKYFDTMLYFKDSLREISVSVLPFEMPESSQCIATHLHEFRSLTKLTLDLYGLPCSNDEPTNFIELEKILNRCKHLEVLEFTWGSVVNSSMGTAEFKKWLSNNVQQVSSLHAFKVGKLEGPHMLEYLVYKYPNVSKASITYLESSSKRIIDAVKDIETVELIIPNTLGIEELKEGITNAEEFKNLILAMKSTTNQVQIQHSSSFDSFGQGLLEITKCIKTGNTKFSILIQGHVRPICKDIISIIGSVHHLETNYIGFADYYQAEDSILERLRCIIPFDSLNKLTSLKFLCDEEISKEISEEIAKYAPNLKHLTINTCCSYDKGHYVFFPQTDFDTLSILSIPNSKKNYLEDQKLLLITEKLDVPQTFYHLLTPGTPSHSRQIFQACLSEDHSKFPQVRIVSRSLSSLNIKLETVTFKTKFEVKAQIKRTNIKSTTQFMLLPSLYNSYAVTIQHIFNFLYSFI